MTNSRFVPLDDVDVLTLIDLEGKDVAGYTVRKCDKLSIGEIMDKLHQKVSKIKSHKDPSHKKQTSAAG